MVADKGQRWVLVHMVRNPMKHLPERSREWQSSRLKNTRPTIPRKANVPYTLHHRPTPDDLDEMVWFHFREEPHWTTYDSNMPENAWLAAFGAKPDRKFTAKPEPK